MITKAAKPHTIGETLIIPAVKEVLTTVVGCDSNIMSSVPLSNSSVSRRVQEMSDDVEATLCSKLQFREFSIQLDETTHRDSEAVLMAYVRYIDDDNTVAEEMLFAKPLETTTKGIDIFKALKDYLQEKEIPLINIVACATDGAPAMVGRYRGLIANLKEEVPHILAVHCVIHRQHLVAKSLSDRLHTSLHLVIKAVNRIKAHALNERLFRELCKENDEEFQRLVLHTEVRWLSKGNCLRRFFFLFESVVQFLQTVDDSLSKALSQIKPDIAYLADFFEKMNELLTKLQGNEVTLVQCKSVINAFIMKLSLFSQNLTRRELCNFPRLKEVTHLEDADIICYSEHLQQVQCSMKERFTDLLQLAVPAWFLNPFVTDVSSVDTPLQESFIELQNDEESKLCFQLKGYRDFWIHQRQRYPSLWPEVKLLILAFPTSYLVEKGFSAITQIISKQRHRLNLQSGDLRLRLTCISPNVAALAQLHQAQGSH